MKKYVVSIILIVLTFMLGMSNVNAASEDLELVDVQVQSKNASISVDDVSLNGNKVTSNITFNKVNDYVAFELTIKNNSDEEYKVISAEDNNTNNNIAISYIYDDNYIGKDETTKVTVKLKYINDLTDKHRLGLNNLNIKVNFAKPDGTTEQLSINPTTGVSIFRYIVLAIISLIGLILILAKNKKKAGTALLILALVSVPFSAIANEKFAINLKFNNIDVISEVNANNYATLIDGQSFNNKSSTYDNFRKATAAEYNLAKDSLTEDNIISTEDSPKVVYMWQTGEDTLYYSDAKTIYMNEDSSYMFRYSNYTSIDLTGLDSSRVTTTQSMFYENQRLTELNLTSFETSNVTDMSYMFYDCYYLEELDLSTFNTSNVTDMSSMFSGASGLKTIYVFDEWDTSSVTEYDYIFNGLYDLVGEEATSHYWETNNYIENYDELEYAHVDGGQSNPGYLTLKGHTKDFSLLMDGGEYNLAEKHYDLAYDTKYFRKATAAEYNSVKDELTDSNIISEYFSPIPTYMWSDGDYALYYSTASSIYTNKYANNMFCYTMYETIDISGMDGSRTISMQSFFGGENLKEVIFGDFDTSNVTDMSYMFYDCENLEEIDLSPLDISNVTDMSYMFYECENLTTIYVSETWDISNVSNTESMFTDSYKLVGEKATSYDENHTDGEYARIDDKPNNPGYLTLTGHTKDFAIIVSGYDFNDMLDSFTTNNKEFRKATTAEYNSAKDTLTDDDFIILANAPNKVYMWETNNSVLYYSNVSTIFLNPDSSHMFESRGFKTIDMSGFDTSNVTDMSYMFTSCSNLATIYVSSTWNISNVNSISSMFDGDYNLVGEQATMYDSDYTEDYLHVDEGPTNPGYLTLTGHTKDFAILAGEDYNYGNVFNNKISSMNTDNKEFRKATSTEYNSVKDTLTNHNIASASNSPINIYMWETNDSVLYYSSATVIYLNKDSNGLFNSTGFRKIDMSGFDATLLEKTSEMFEGCENLEEIDVSSFDMSNVTDADEMFNGCHNLMTIYVSSTWDISNVNETSSMFVGDYNIVGEQMTTYDENYTDGDYAHVDGGLNNPGYLTLKGHTKNFAILAGYDDEGDNYENVFNDKITSMNTDNKEFRKATVNEYNSVKDSLTDDDIASADNSPINIYMWETNDSVLYYSSAPVIYLSKNSYSLFDNTGFIKIDMSGFDTRNVTNAFWMFANCSNLTTIYVSELWDISNMEYTDNMFSNDESLVGGQETVYDSNYTGGSYAHIDGGPSDPGYLTDIADKQ